jgi:hypothetical protein
MHAPGFRLSSSNPNVLCLRCLVVPNYLITCAWPACRRMNEWCVFQWDFSVWNLFGCAPLSAGIFVTLMFLKQLRVLIFFLWMCYHTYCAACFQYWSLVYLGFQGTLKSTSIHCVPVEVIVYLWIFTALWMLISHQQQLLLSSTIIGTGVWNPDTMLWWQCNNKKDLIHVCCCLKFRENSE